MRLQRHDLHEHVRRRSGRCRRGPRGNVLTCTFGTPAALNFKISQIENRVQFDKSVNSHKRWAGWVVWPLDGDGGGHQAVGVIAHLLVEEGHHVLHRGPLVGLRVPALLHHLLEVERAVVGNLRALALEHVE